MPTELALLLTTGFNPAAERQEYTDYADLWQLYLDLVELDQLKLEELIEAHHDEEDETKLALRKTLAVSINLIPSVLDVVKLYLFAEEPVFDVNGDAQLKSFLADCDGAGTRWADYVRQRALPMSMALGMVETLVANPMQAGQLLSEADAVAAGVAPRVFTISPIRRNDWSCMTNGSYNAVRFQDQTADAPSLLATSRDSIESYVTLQAAGTIAEASADRAFWVRSSRKNGGAWTHEADYCPTARVPVATLYYQQALDTPHWGISKIAMMAVLTKLMIQVLSWTTEDILANLAILGIPTKGGRQPKNEDGTPMVSELSAFTQLFYDMEASSAPAVIQGDVSHIQIKLTLCEMFVKEILRLAHLSTVSGEDAGLEKSGFHAVVNRSELFQELSDTAGRLDVYSLEVLALARSWISGEDWNRQRLAESGVRACFYKGPYTIEPLEQVIRNATAAIEMFRQISPTLVESQYRQVARAAMYQDDPDVDKVMREIAKNTGAVVEEMNAEAELAASAVTQGNVGEER